MNRKKSIILVILVALLMVVPLNGCSQNADKINEDLAEGLGEKLAEGLTGGDIETDNEWPGNMPEKVPEFTEGVIENTSSMTVGGKSNITIVLSKVDQDDFTEYLKKIESSVFEQFMYAKSGGIETGTYTEGENALTLQYAVDSKELIITFSGN